jgi:hypothetical protein
MQVCASPRPMKTCRALLLLLTLSFAAACTAPTEGDGNIEEATEAVTRATPTRKATSLVALLSRPDGIQMPPVGVTNAANILGGKAELASLHGSLLDELRSRATGPLPTMGGSTLVENFGLGEDEDGLDLAGALRDQSDKSLDVNDMALKVKLGYERADIKSYLLDSIVAPSAKAEATALLAGLKANYAYLQFYDYGAEINAQEIILIQPISLSAHVIVLYVGYAHA